MSINKKEELEKLYTNSDEVKSCQTITLAQKYNFVSDLGHGNPDARIFFVGEAPGAKEDETGIPFVGQAGKILDENLQEIGLAREDVWIGNVVRYRPTTNDGKRNRKPRKGEEKACLPLLMKEIEIVDPDIIVPLGTTAWQALTEKKESISNVAGEQLTWKGRIMFPMYHPAYAIYNREIREDMVEHMKELKTLIDSIQK